MQFCTHDSQLRCENQTHLWIFLNIISHQSPGLCVFLQNFLKKNPTFRRLPITNPPAKNKLPSSPSREIPILYYHCVIHCMRFYSPSKCSLAIKDDQKMDGPAGWITKSRFAPIVGRKSLWFFVWINQINQEFRKWGLMNCVVFLETNLTCCPASWFRICGQWPFWDFHVS